MAQTEAKLPRSVRKGPLITVTCECGQRRELRYDERWKCDGCGRRYDTSRIPLDEYAAIRRTQLRYRMIPLISGLILLAGDIAFFLTGKTYGALIALNGVRRASADGLPPASYGRGHSAGAQLKVKRALPAALAK